MGDSTENMVREYKAFISYRHTELDKKVAKRIHSMIEGYVIPKDLRPSVNESSNGVAPKKLGKVFRDEEELPVSSDLTESIEIALDHSEYLIVICSPNTPESLWVQREIAFFLEHHDRAHIIGVLADGTPEQSFPKLLTEISETNPDGSVTTRQVEPLAANLTDVDHHYSQGRLKKEAVRIYSALIGCPFDTLWQRDRRQKTRNLIAVMALVLAIAAAFSFSMLVKNREITARNEQIEAQNTRISEQYAELEANKDQIETQKNQIEEQYADLEKKKNEIEEQKNIIEGNNKEISLQNIDTLISEAKLMYEKGDMGSAIGSAISAKNSVDGLLSGTSSNLLSNDEKRVLHEYLNDSEYIINLANGTGMHRYGMRTAGIVEQDEDIESLVVSSNGKHLYTLGSRGWVRCFSTDNYEAIWEANSLSGGYERETAYRQKLFIVAEYNIIIVTRYDYVTALNLDDGSLSWSYFMGNYCGCDFFAFSDDLRQIAVIKSEGSLIDNVNKLLILDSKDGSVVKEVDLTDAFGSVDLYSRGNVVGCFSEDGSMFAGVIYTGQLDGNLKLVFIVNLVSNEVKLLESKAFPFGVKIPEAFNIGLLLNEKSGSLLVMSYEPNFDYYRDDSEEKVYGVRMDELFFDGTVGNTSFVPVSVPERAFSKSYPSTFVPGHDNNGILASCMGTAFLYRKDNGMLIDHDSLSAGNILNRYWIDEQDLIYTFMDSGGYQHIKDLSAISEFMDGFFDRNHILLLALSDIDNSKQGTDTYALTSDAVCAIVCEGDPRTAYIMKPANDPEIYAPDYLSDISNVYKIESISGQKLVVVEGLNGSEGRIHIMDVAESKEIKSADVDVVDVIDALFSKDLVHFSYMVGKDIYIHDIDEGSDEKVFDVDGSLVACETMSSYDNTILHAALIYDDTSSSSSAKANKIIYNVDGRTGEKECKDNENWITRGKSSGKTFLWSGAGRIMTADYGDDGRRKAFVGYNILLSEFADAPDIEYVVKDESTAAEEGEVVMDEYDGYFAVLDKDNKIRVYSLFFEKLLFAIDVPDIDMVGAVRFCNYDKTLAVFTIDGHLYLYDVFYDGYNLPTGELKAEYELGEPYAYLKSWTTLYSWTDLEKDENHRLYISLNGDYAICLDWETYKKVMDVQIGIDAYDYLSNQIFSINDDGKIICLKTLSEDETIKRLNGD